MFRATETILAFMLVFAARGQAQCPLYVGELRPLGGESGSDVVLVDLDSDGDLDLLAADAEQDALLVQLNAGDGTFGPSVRYGCCTSPTSGLAAADIDGDGDADAIVSCSTDGAINVLRNRGNGRFAAAVSYPSVVFANAVDVADINGDDLPDVIVTGTAPATGAHLNLSGGTFGPLVDLGVAPTYSFNAAPGDVNNDGSIDLVLQTYNPNSVSVRLNDGSGAFTEILSVPDARDPVLVDFDADGDSDLLLADGEVVLYWNDGAGSFQRGPSCDCYEYLSDFAVRDFDGDGDVDIAGVSQTIGEVWVIENVAGVSLGTHQRYPSAYANEIAAGDIHNDGRVDIVARDANGLHVLENRGAAGFLAPTQVPVSFGAYDAALIDLNSDGALDALVAIRDGNAVEVYFNDGTGQFTLSQSLTVGAEPYAVSAGDIDADGDWDAVVANGSGDTLSVLENDGTGIFHVASTLAVSGMLPIDLVLADLDADLDLDLAVIHSDNNDLQIFRNDGSGGFQSSAVLSAAFGPRRIEVGDIDGDGDPDLVTVNFFSDEFAVFLNNGQAGFVRTDSYDTSNGPRALGLVDLDHDLDLDVVVGSEHEATAQVFTNDGTGHFAFAVSLSLRGSAFDLRLTDLDADSNIDLAVVEYFANVLEIWPGFGDGTFGPSTAFATSASPRAIAPGDINADGDLDLIVPCRSAPAITVFHNSRVIQSTQPADVDACQRQTATFTTGTLAPGQISYQWSHDGVALSDGLTGAGSNVSGSTTSQLVLSNLHPADAGEYTVAIDNGCTGFTTQPALLTVATACAADLTCDGTVNLSDLGLVLGDFNCQGDLCAGDVDEDGDTDLSDLNLVLVAYLQPCR